jgi:hypothetical protein
MTSRFIGDGVMEAERGPRLEMRSWRVDRPELVVRRVCERCNNDWMSGLQNVAKPIIERLWDQEAATLDLADCRALAEWAVMTSMTIQTLDEEENWLYTEYERTVMWKAREIPRFVGIWIAQCIGHDSIYSQGRRMLSGQSDNSDRQARGNAITLAFGSLAMQVLKVIPAGNADRLKNITVSQGFGDWENIALQLWPLKGDPVIWPPARAIRCEENLEEFAGRFRGRDGDLERGFTPEQFRATADEVAGVGLAEWFRTAISSTDELDYSEALDRFGLRFATPKEKQEDPKKKEAAAKWNLEVRQDAFGAQKEHL